MNSWYPDPADLAEQNFTAIHAELESTQVQSALRKWAASGAVPLDDLVSVSLFDPSGAPASAHAHANTSNSQVVGPAWDSCAGVDCTTCDKCQEVCLSLVWCLPCWGM